MLICLKIIVKVKEAPPKLLKIKIKTEKTDLDSNKKNSPKNFVQKSK